jgi:hypothetical protein
LILASMAAELAIGFDMQSLDSRSGAASTRDCGLRSGSSFNDILAIVALRAAEPLWFVVERTEREIEVTATANHRGGAPLADSRCRAEGGDCRPRRGVDRADGLRDLQRRQKSGWLIRRFDTATGCNSNSS